MALGALAFYSDQAGTALTSSFVYFNFGFTAQISIFKNDDTSGGNVMVGSYDGTNTHFTLKAGETLTYDFSTDTGIWLKYTTGAPNYRVMARGR